MSFDIYTLVVAIAVFFLLGCLVSFLVFRRAIQHYMSFLFGARDPDSIEVLKSIEVGGLKQWIHIRGRRKDNPILLFIHGGPGMSQIGWHDSIQRSWEDFFTVVQWDQRQTGKSFQPFSKVRHTLTGSQYIADAEEVVRYIREQFGGRKLFLMGTSYGTYIGMHLAKRHPNWFYAYLGIAQMTQMREHVEGEYTLLLDYARQQGYTEVVDKLQRMAPYPSKGATAKNVFFEQSVYVRDQACKFGKSYPDSLASVASLMKMGKLLSPFYSLREFYNAHYRKNFSQSEEFLEELLDCNLVAEVGSHFDTPIFFLTGVQDFHVSYKHTDSWFNNIQAPYKEQIFFHHSASVPHQTEPGAFLIALVTKVLPLSQQEKEAGGSL